MRILVVEDDDYQGGWINTTLIRHFPEEEISWIKTESDFRAWLGSEIQVNPPDVFIIDVMLRWTKPAPRIQVRPDDVKAEGFYRAGLRCMKLLQEYETTKNIPVILYTVLDRIELKEELLNLRHNVLYLRKKSDPRQLIQKIRDLRNQRNR